MSNEITHHAIPETLRCKAASTPVSAFGPSQVIVLTLDNRVVSVRDGVEYAEWNEEWNATEGKWVATIPPRNIKMIESERGEQDA